MRADQAIKLIQTLEPIEIEKLFVLIKEYEVEVRRRQMSVCYIEANEKFDKAADQVFSENSQLFQKLAIYEKNEREAAVK